MTEEPYKTPYYVALLLLLHQPLDDIMKEEEESQAAETMPIGKLVLDDFWKGFQAFLDKQSWRELRLCVRATV